MPIEPMPDSDRKPRGEPPDFARGGEPEATDDQRRAMGLAGIAVILVLLICALLLVRALHRESQTEDCLMAGLRSCAPTLPAPVGG